jgi:hypothetical protein
MAVRERLAAPFRDIAGWQEHRTAAAARHAATLEAGRAARHEAYLQELAEEFAGAPRIGLRRYHHLTDDEVREGTEPAVEYFHSTAEVRLYHLLEPDPTRRAWVIRALAMRLDGGAKDAGGATGDVIDVKPTDFAPIEAGAVTLGPVLELHNAAGTDWRFFLELGFGPAAGGLRGEVRTRRVVAEGRL